MTERKPPKFPHGSSRIITILIYGIVLVIVLGIVFNCFTINSLKHQIAIEEERANSVNAGLSDSDERLASLRSQIGEQEAQLSSLQEEVAALPTPTPTPAPTPTPTPTPEPTPTPVPHDLYDSSVSYEQLFRNPQDYEGKKLCYFGKVGYVSAAEWRGANFYLYINGLRNEIRVYYDPSNGRVLSGDVVVVYGTVIDADTSDPKLAADAIYFPTEEETIDLYVDYVFGDVEGSDDLKENLKAGEEELRKINGGGVE